MIKGYYCTNIFSENAEELIAFYKATLEVPFIKTDDDNKNGVYLGFLENAPMLCIWDCGKCKVAPTGHQSFAFSSQNLDLTIKQLREKKIFVPEPVRYGWGTYEVRLNDTDGNEVVLVEFA